MKYLYNEFSLLVSNTDIDFIVKSIYLILFLIIIGIVGVIIFKFIKMSVNYNNYNFEKLGVKINADSLHYYKGIPCDKNIFKAYFLVKAYNLYNPKIDFLGCILLKWLFENKITLKKEVDNPYSEYYVEQTIIIKPGVIFENKVEQEIYDILLEFSHNNVIEYDELDTLSVSTKYLSWLKKSEDYGRSLYEIDGLVYKKDNNYILKDELKQEAINLLGLKKYLKDFSRMEEKSSIEVKLWKEYLIFAKMFGLSEKINMEFKYLYPDEDII